MGGEHARITALLGPTNTGKTHFAIERMLSYPSGVIGLPLRLLAREVYDKIVGLRGPNAVALITGEERIMPPRPRFWVCTVEAMPVTGEHDFLAVDEIQLCADAERGHIFTDRLLHARGRVETIFMGAETMRSTIAQLVPRAQFVKRERFSHLTYAGSKKISRMPARSAIVGFSVENVYAIAELIRRQKGGCAVVMGALSPRTRNAQVELYQNGDVDYLVATDAIGMGLNLDLHHVAFSATSKFDGRRMRPLTAQELGQIAGRAGRYQRDGSFGVTGEAAPLHEETVEAITEHRFEPIRKLEWRNPELDYRTPAHLIASLEARPDNLLLARAREADDLGALKALAAMPELAPRTTSRADTKLLWDVCRIPDFRGISHAEHASLLAKIFADLHGLGRIPDDWFARQIKRIDRTDGDIDTLSKRLAYIRTWTYVAQRKGWLDDESHWRGATRAVEDRLSDALHGALTQRFVDRRTSALLRRLKQKESLVADVNDKGEVAIDGHVVGRLEGFRFRQADTSDAGEAKTLRSAAVAALGPQFSLLSDRFYNAPDTELDFTEQGGLMWGEHAVGKLVKGSEALKPQVQAFVDDEAGAEVAEKVTRRLQHFIDRKIAALFEPLMNVQNDEALTGLARGFGFQLIEALGVIPREQVAQDVKALDQDARGALRKHGVRFGQFTIFMPLLLKPAPTRLRLVLWSLAQGLQEFPESPPPGLVTIPAPQGMPEGYAPMSGYRSAGSRAIRIDMLERLADQLRGQDSRGGFEATADMLSITGMTLEQFADLMGGLGYKAEKGERAKVKPVDAVVPEAEGAAAPEGDVPVMDAAEAQPEGGIIEQPTPDTPADDISPEAEALPDAGEAPVAETPAEPLPDEPVVETPAEELTPGTAPDAEIAGPEMEVFYTFTWGGNRGGRRNEQQGNRPKGQGKGKPRGKGGPKGKGGSRRDEGAKSFQSRPPRKEKQIDPDNPFAQALMGLKKE